MEVEKLDALAVRNSVNCSADVPTCREIPYESADLRFITLRD